MILNIVSKIGYLIACAVFGYMIWGLTLDWFKTRNKKLIIAIALMVLVILITMSEVI